MHKPILINYGNTLDFETQFESYSDLQMLIKQLERKEVTKNEVIEYMGQINPRTHLYELLNDYKTKKLIEEKPEMSIDIVVIKTDELNNLFRKISGYACIEKNINNFDLIFNGFKVPMQRAKAEYNYQQVRQPVSFVIVSDKNHENIFMLCKIKQSNETRLQNQWGFIGGHWDATDDSFTKSMFRELDEEINLKKDNILETKFHGLINFENQKVESDHIGFVFEVTINDINPIYVKEPEKNTGRWFPRSYLKVYENIEDFSVETWTRLLIRKLL